MHDLEKRFPSMPEKLAVIIKVPVPGKPGLGKIYYQDNSVAKEVAFKLIDLISKAPRVAPKAEPELDKPKETGGSDGRSSTGGNPKPGKSSSKRDTGTSN